MSIIRGNQDILGTLIFGGVFERHPKLKVVCVEADAGWVPHYMYRMDHAYDRHRGWLGKGVNLSKAPSEYFREHIYTTFQDDWVAFRSADQMNWRRLMWANDFPHSDSTWPWSQQMLAEQSHHLTSEQRRAILCDNVADLYAIDLSTLQSGRMKRTGADVVAGALQALGVRHAFCIVSIHNMPLLDAINRLGFTRLIDVRHEQAGVHAADGYARATGELGVMLASTGPGTTNTVTGLYEAAFASSRVLLITGQAETGFYGRGLGYVHEADQQVAMLRTVTCAVESPRRACDIAPLLAHVVAEMSRGRGQPGALEIPIDLQYADAGEQPFAAPTVRPNAPDPAALSAAVGCAQRRAASRDHRRWRCDRRRRGRGAAGARAATRRAGRHHRQRPRRDSRGRRAFAGEPLPESRRRRGDCVRRRDARGGHAVSSRRRRRESSTETARRAHSYRCRSRRDRPRASAPRSPSSAMPGSRSTAMNAQLVDASPNDAQFNAALFEVRDGVRASLRSRIGADYAAIMDQMRARSTRRRQRRARHDGARVQLRQSAAADSAPAHVDESDVGRDRPRICRWRSARRSAAGGARS